MIAFEGMLVEAAEQAGIKVPPEELLDADPGEGFDPMEYPHFHVFCALQLCRPIQWGEHWDNAKIIAAIPEERLTEMVLQDFLELGFHYQQ